MPRKWSHKTTLESCRAHRNANQAKWREFLKDIVEFRCALCGYDKCMSALDFHHRKNEKKDFVISQFMRSKPYTRVNRVRLLDEVNKCTILCATCHREVHYAD